MTEDTKARLKNAKRLYGNLAAYCTNRTIEHSLETANRFRCEAEAELDAAIDSIDGEPLIEDDEFWQGVVDATDCILTGRVIEAICTALDRRAAPKEPT